MGESRFKLRFLRSRLGAPRPNSTRQTKAAGREGASWQTYLRRGFNRWDKQNASFRQMSEWNVELLVTTKQLPAVVCGRERIPYEKNSCRQKEILAAGLTGEEVATPSNHFPLQ